MGIFSAECRPIGLSQFRSLVLIKRPLLYKGNNNKYTIYALPGLGYKQPHAHTALSSAPTKSLELLRTHILTCAHESRVQSPRRMHCGHKQPQQLTLPPFLVRS